MQQSKRVCSRPEEADELILKEFCISLKNDMEVLVVLRQL